MVYICKSYKYIRFIGYKLTSCKFIEILGMIKTVVLCLLIILVIVIVYRRRSSENFINFSFGSSKPSADSQVSILTDKYGSLASSKRSVIDNPPSQSDIATDDQTLINFHVLGCYAPGYIGPKDNGYYNFPAGIQAAANAGCRLFVFEIDYFDDCGTKENPYFPCLVVRNSQGISEVERTSETVHCNSLNYSNITDVCNNINDFLFTDACQNKKDPIIIVLSFKRLPPPGDGKSSITSQTVLDYFSLVAKCLNASKLRNRFLSYNHLNGGNYSRQAQEQKLINSPISALQDRVLIFSTTNTSGFCDTSQNATTTGSCRAVVRAKTNTPYSTDEDLDFLVVLRLSHNISKICMSEVNNSAANIDAVESFLESSISKKDNPDVFEEKVNMMRRKWSICLPRDPLSQVSNNDYTYLTTNYGINCVVTQLYQPGNDYLFNDQTFKTYSYYPRIQPVRNPHPPVLTAGPPSKQLDSKCGMVKGPSFPGQ
jgi:hypothetical protein